jgi:hypothetical protein
MTQGEHIAQLEQENTELRAQFAEARQQITPLAERVNGFYKLPNLSTEDAEEPPNRGKISFERA